MSYIDFNNLYEQLGSKYAEVQKVVTRWRTSSEIVQAGGYEFTITTLPTSEGFWSSSKVLISLKPLQKTTMQTALVASNRNEVQQLLQDPVQVKDILKLFALIHSADCSTLRGQQEILGALNALKWTTYEDPTTPEIFREVLKKQTISELLPNIALLESTFERMNSINPLKLKRDDIATMTALRETVDDPKTPQTLKEAVKQKVIDVSKTINPKAIECCYAIPTDVLCTMCSDKTGAYAVQFGAPDRAVETLLKKDTAEALQTSRKEIVELFTQSNGEIAPSLTEELQAYGEKMIEPLMIAKEKYLLSEQELKTKLRAFGQKAAQVLQEELKDYKGDTASLDDCLQAYETKMRSFTYNLLKEGQSASQIDQKENYLYRDMPVAIDGNGEFVDFNTVAVLNTRLQEPLSDKTLEGLKKELEQLRKKLTNCQTSEQLQVIEEHYQEVNEEIKSRSAFREQCLTNLAVMQTFGKSKEDDESFSTRAIATTQQLSSIKLLFQDMDKEQGKYSSELEKAKSRLLDANKAAPQDSIASTSSIVTQ